MIDIEQRITAAIERITSGNAPMRVPADETDPDLVLAYCLAEIRRLRAALAARQPVGEPVAWQSMATCPRDGTAVLLRWGEDHVSPGWWCAAVSPIQNEDGTWPRETGGFPWAFFDMNDGVAFVNHAVDTEYGPTHWAPYVYPAAQAVDLGAVRQALQAAEGLATICASVDGYSREEVAASGRAMKQQFADALAKVDSQAVGK